MKNLALVASVALLAGTALANQAQQQKPVTVQMQCRDMSKTGSTLQPNETVVNGMACHPVTVPATNPESATTAAPANAPANAPAQANSTSSDLAPASAASADSSASNSSAAPAQDSPAEKSSKPRVYISDSNSWVMSGGFAGGASADANSFSSASAGHFSGGSDPQTVEIIKNFMNKCPGVIVTRNKANADYAVLFDREGGKRGTSGFGGLLRKVDKIAVFRKNGDAVYSESARSVGTVVKNACSAIEKSEAN